MKLRGEKNWQTAGGGSAGGLRTATKMRGTIIALLKTLFFHFFQYFFHSAQQMGQPLNQNKFSFAQTQKIESLKMGRKLGCFLRCLSAFLNYRYSLQDLRLMGWMIFSHRTPTKNTPPHTSQQLFLFLSKFTLFHHFSSKSRVANLIFELEEKEHAV